MLFSIDQTRANVIVRHAFTATGRKRRDGMDYEIMTAPPGEDPKVIARMSHGGDAYAYADEIRRRLESRGADVNFINAL